MAAVAPTRRRVVARGEVEVVERLVTIEELEFTLPKEVS
jgi:hypothetical protein